MAAPSGLLRRCQRLQTRRAFAVVLRRGVRRRGDHLTVTLVPQDPQPLPGQAAVTGSRLGLAVPRGAGNAPARARLRRLLREAFRSCRQGWPALDLVVQVHHGWPGAGLAEVATELEALVRQALARQKSTRVSPARG